MSLVKRIPPLFLFILLLLVACSGDEIDAPANLEEEFVSEYVGFGGERVFGEQIGLPIEFEGEGIRVQYFENLRLEHPIGQPQNMRLSELGEWAYEGLREEIVDEVVEDGRSRDFPETGHTVRDEFLAFYDAFQGDELLGWPISPQLIEGGVRVQYFENGILEWRPQFPIDQRVQLGRIGKAHFDSEPAIPEFTSLPRLADFAGLESVDLVSSVQRPVVYSGDEQRLFVTVSDEFGRLVEGIGVTAVLHHNDGEAEIDLGVTDGEGEIGLILPLDGISSGQDVMLEVMVVGNGRLLGRTQLKFRVWW